MRDRLLNTLVALLIFLVALLALTWPFKANAQEHSPSEMQGHAQWHEVYKKWQRPSGLGDCCQDQHCHPVDDADVRTRDGNIAVRIAGEWIPVRPEIIRPYPSPDTQHHMCNAGRLVFCIVLGGGA